MSQNEIEDINAFYRDLTYLALDKALDRSNVEGFCRRFLSLIFQGQENVIQKKLRSVEPQIAGYVYETIADYLDNVQSSGVRWTNSAVVLLTFTGGKPFKPLRLSPDGIARIEDLFEIPCFVEPRLFNPEDIDDIAWKKWLERSQSLFEAQDGKPNLALALGQGGRVGNDGCRALLLDFQTTNCNQNDLLDLVNTNVQTICETLQATDRGLSVQPLSRAVSAHLANMRFEQIKTQTELSSWESLLQEDGGAVRWDRHRGKDKLTLWQGGALRPVATIQTKAASPWAQAARLAVLKDWLEQHPAVVVLDSPVRNRRLHSEWRAALRKVSVTNYEMMPEAPETTPIGYCMMDRDGPVQDDRGSVNVTLTAHEAANMAWRIKMITGQEFTVASLPFEALYDLAG